MKFRAFELADEFAVETYKQTRQLPKDELLGPISQMCRVAASVAPNIVEGCFGIFELGVRTTTPREKAGRFIAFHFFRKLLRYGVDFVHRHTTNRAVEPNVAHNMLECRL